MFAVADIMVFASVAGVLAAGATQLYAPDITWTVEAGEDAGRTLEIGDRDSRTMTGGPRWPESAVGTRCGRGRRAGHWRRWRRPRARAEHRRAGDPGGKNSSPAGPLGRKRPAFI